MPRLTFTTRRWIHLVFGRQDRGLGIVTWGGFYGTPHAALRAIQRAHSVGASVVKREVWGNGQYEKLMEEVDRG